MSPLAPSRRVPAGHGAGSRRHVLLQHRRARLAAALTGRRVDRHEVPVAEDRVPGEEVVGLIC